MHGALRQLLIYDGLWCKVFDAAIGLDLSRRFEFKWLNESDLDRIMGRQIEAIDSTRREAVVADIAPTLSNDAEV